MSPIFNYNRRVLEALAAHGLVPRPDTPPHMLRDAVRDLYRFEIRRLRSSLLAGHIAKRDYASHVVMLRQKYPLLSLPLDLWASEVDHGMTNGATEKRRQPELESCSLKLDAR